MNSYLLLGASCNENQLGIEAPMKINVKCYCHVLKFTV